MSAVYKELFDSSPDGILLIDADTQRVIEFNDAACRQLGYTRAEFAGLRISDYETLETPAAVDAHVQEAIHGGRAEFDTLHRTKAGEIRHVHVWARTLEVNGRVVFHAIFRDITERVRADNRLREIDALFRTVLNNAPITIFAIDQHGVFTLSEGKGLERVGLAPGENVGVSALDLYGDLPIVQPDGGIITGREAVSRVLGGEAVTGITRLRDEYFDNCMLPYREGEGRVVGLIGVATVITERQLADESQRLQSAALHAAADAIVITDRAGIIRWVNPAFTQITGYTINETLGRNPRDLLKSGQHDQPFYRDLWDTILAGRTWHGQIINRRKDGSLYTEAQSITPILDGSGTVTHFVAIKRDVTERLQLEAQYRQAQRMESVGQLASGIAHDFNNLLTVINGVSDLILEKTANDDPVHADVQEIYQAGQRAATLTRQLLAFSRQQILEPRVMNLNIAIAGMDGLLRRLLGEDIEIAMTMATGLDNVKADPGQIEQVVTNLAVNARDAMPQGGRLTIETQNLLVDEEYARQSGAGVSPGSYVLLSVTDSGVGMDETIRARVFEPFFTTKAPGQGTGLGLSTVYGIVKQSQGFINVYSEVAHGTSFKIYLPRVAETEDADQVRPAQADTSHGGWETILLVEDNAGLRKLARRFLEPAGYTVLDAPTGEEALALVEHHQAQVHLLLSDVVMPGMSGRHLAERLLQTHPGMKVLYMSGYTSDTIVRHGILDAQVAFLNKPFSAAGLLQKVREVLDSQL